MPNPSSSGESSAAKKPLIIYFYRAIGALIECAILIISFDKNILIMLSSLRKDVTEEIYTVIFVLDDFKNRNMTASSLVARKLK